MFSGVMVVMTVASDSHPVSIRHVALETRAESFVLDPGRCRILSSVPGNTCD